MGKTPGWLKGCGIGCGVAILLAVILSVSATLWFRSQFRGVDRASDSHDALVESLGDPEDYIPLKDGRLDPDRLRIFVEVREALRPSRDRLDSLFADYPPRDLDDEDPPPFVIFKVLTGLGGMISPMGDHIDLRNRLLLEAGMGLGEYQHLYGLVYYAWLGHDPGACPVVGESGRRGRRAGRPLFRGEDSTLGPERTRERYRRLTMAHLDNLRAALADDPGADPDWIETVAGERRRFRDAPGGVAWRDRIPSAVAATLEPLRARLAETWHAAGNPLEYPLGEDFSWHWGDD